jgi:hypothetical protein
MSVKRHQLSNDGKTRMFSDDMFGDNKVYNSDGVFIGKYRQRYRFGDKEVYFRDDGKMILIAEDLDSPDSIYKDGNVTVKGLPEAVFNEKGEVVRRVYPNVMQSWFQKNKSVLKNKRVSKNKSVLKNKSVSKSKRVSKSNRKRAPPKRC